MQIQDHNLKAYKALIKSFKKANRACIVHPTGLGKSYIGYQLIADNPDSAFLVLTSQLFSHSSRSCSFMIFDFQNVIEFSRSYSALAGVLFSST